LFGIERRFLEDLLRQMLLAEWEKLDDDARGGRSEEEGPEDIFFLWSTWRLVGGWRMKGL